MSKTQKHVQEDDGISRGYFSNLKANAYVHEFYLSGTIEGPENYIEWFNIIRNASEYDTVKVYINSGGGDLNTALQFMRVLSDTEADTIASVEGSCMSAATMVMLSCDAIEVSPTFTVHGTHIIVVAPWARVEKWQTRSCSSATGAVSSYQKSISGSFLVKKSKVSSTIAIFG
jgi:ATP-dependent protease ClpP protease subunit